MIYLENVSKIYDNAENEALSHVNLHVERGEFVFVTGKSGSGKSTLIRLLIREISQTEGRIVVNGKEISGMKPAEVPYYRRNLGIVFQDMRLLEDRTVFENVAFAREILYGYRRDTNNRVASILSFLNLTEFYHRFPRELSGGEKQKVVLARAIMNDPAILLADEPTGNLDPRASEEMMNLFERVHKRGVTVLAVTHDAAQAERLRHRCIVLEDGKASVRGKGGPV